VYSVVDSKVIRAALAKEVGMGNPAEETNVCPDQNLNRYPSELRLLKKLM